VLSHPLPTNFGSSGQRKQDLRNRQQPRSEEAYVWSAVATRPITEEGKQRSRCNAVRHGLTAETVIGAPKDADQAFEAAIMADYDA
jgi:hypothetical protein